MCSCPIGLRTSLEVNNSFRYWANRIFSLYYCMIYLIYHIIFLGDLFVRLSISLTMHSLVLLHYCFLFVMFFFAFISFNIILISLCFSYSSASLIRVCEFIHKTNIFLFFIHYYVIGPILG